MNLEFIMQVASDIKSTTRSDPLVTKSADASQVELQRQIDKLNSKVTNGKDHERILERIKLINEDIEKIRAQHEKEREKLKTWGIKPSTWEYIGGAATAITIFSDIASIASNIPASLGGDDDSNSSSTPIIITTTVSAGVGIIAGAIFAAFTYGQYKINKRVDEFDQKLHQNELMSIFLHSYQEFSEKSPTNLEDQVSALKECVEKLKNISESTLPQEAKDHWLCTMIEKLPDDHRLKKTLEDQKEIASSISTRMADFYKASSGDATFLNDTIADQAADNNTAKPMKDELRAQYDTNLRALCDEFGMDIQQMHIHGYKFNSDYKIKKINESLNHVHVSI